MVADSLQWPLGIDIRRVVDARKAKAEKPQKFRAIALDIRQGFEVVGVDLLPQRSDFPLYVFAHFAVVDANAPLGVGGGICIETAGEEAVHLLDAAFVAALFLHHLVEQRDVERHDGDGGTRLGHHGLVDGDVGTAASGLQKFVERLGRLFQMILGLADGPVAIDRVGNFRADVGIGDGANAVGEHARFVEVHRSTSASLPRP